MIEVKKISGAEMEKGKNKKVVEVVERNKWLKRNHRNNACSD